MEFIKAIKGQTRVADKRIGTCTSTVPASTIDYRIIHEKFERTVNACHVDLVSKLSPRRPVWAMLELEGGENRYRSSVS